MGVSGSVLLATALAMASQLPAANAMLNEWWLVSGTKDQVAFVHRGSIRGQRSARQAEVINVLPRTIGIRAQSMTYQFDCDRNLVTTLRIEGLSSDGQNLGPIETARAVRQPMIAGTLGDYARQFACDEAQKAQPELGYASMLDPLVAGDHFYRLLGLGLDREVAGGLAGLDAERAPQTFERLLNALVHTDLQLYVRAIKTPNAEVQ